ncbi:hypothetical protein BB561_003230 [Smittium simulii]|uniref:Uncharacterized protein n=1 Tax=Smittium simulii TaxID=133385 RepID=A0A2T9YMF5_9FUNG|nr:hypothetical protein BB561_003230 [Smittium simulii]
MFSTFPGQKNSLNAVLDELCLPDIQCGTGYIGIDCLIKDTKIEGTISCHIKGKPGQSKKGIDLTRYPENTGNFFKLSDYDNYINTVCKKAAAPAVEAAPPQQSPEVVQVPPEAVPGSLRESCHSL